MAFRGLLQKLFPSYESSASTPTSELPTPTSDSAVELPTVVGPALAIPAPLQAIPPPADAITIPPPTPTPTPQPKKSQVSAVVGLQTGIAGITLIKFFESFLGAAYKDIAGVWTIGYGTTRINGVPVKKGMVCTHAEALEWLQADIRKFEEAVRRVTPQSRPLTQYQFDACVCFAYNIGAGGFTTSTVGKKIRSGQAATVTEANFMAWSKVRDPKTNTLVESRGLVRRRRAEYELFSTGRNSSYVK